MDPNRPYLDFARDLQTKAEQAHAEWYNSLSSAEKAKVDSLGLNEPSADTHRVGGHGPGERGDAADSVHARVEAVIPDDTPRRDSPTGSGMDEGTLEAVRRIAGALINEPNPKISVAGLAYALNLDALSGLGSMRDYARTLNVSVEAVRKKKAEWERELGISSMAFSKSTRARRALSVAQKTKHWRMAKWRAPQSTRKTPSHHQPSS